MTPELVLELLDAMTKQSIVLWIGGGWGVDALAGRQTRGHRDIDVMVDDRQADEAIQALEQLGYIRETDWWPTRVEFVRPDGGCVDLHPLKFHEDGTADLLGLDGDSFHYPLGSFAEGRIAGHSVSCLSESQQRTLHSGYESRPQDLHDLQVLDSLA
jgi:lincosamide nucleotidyltransferase A/C/D/E